MKKTVNRIISVATFVIGVILATMLLLLTFNVIPATELNNNIVKSIFIILTVFLVIFGATIITLAFSDSDSLREVFIFNQKSVNTKATKGVITKLVRKHLKDIEGVKFRKNTILITEYGITLKIVITVRNKPVDQVTSYMKCLLLDVFKEVLGVKLHSVDFKLSRLSNEYVPDKIAIEQKSEDILAINKVEEDAIALEDEQTAIKVAKDKELKNDCLCGTDGTTCNCEDGTTCNCEDGTTCNCEDGTTCNCEDGTTCNCEDGTTCTCTDGESCDCKAEPTKPAEVK